MTSEESYKQFLLIFAYSISSLGLRNTQNVKKGQKSLKSHKKSHFGQNSKKTTVTKKLEKCLKNRYTAICFFQWLFRMSREVSVTLLGVWKALGARKMAKTGYKRSWYRFWVGGPKIRKIVKKRYVGKKLKNVEKIVFRPYASFGGFSWCLGRCG